MPAQTQDTFTPDEVRALEPYFTNTDRPVFALRNLPETVKGALFSRYSRSAKSLRRLFLDEFLGDVQEGGAGAATGTAGSERADRLYAKVFNEYGDDSVAQLGGAHVACEGVSNILTKVLEWGRLMAYLEQSTRYVPYTAKPGGRWKYHVPAEVMRSPFAGAFTSALDFAFETYAKWIPAMEDHFRSKYPKAAEDSDAVYRSVIRAKALDTLRGLLPAATTSNLGLYGTGQAYEALILRMRAHPLEEVRAYADMLLHELRQIMPAFVARIPQPDRGGRWVQYFEQAREATRAAVNERLAGVEPEPRDEVTLTEFDPEGEIKVVASALYSATNLPDDQLLAVARQMSGDDRAAVLRAYVGERANRRHKPGRAFERTRYRFDVLTDYGAFRDLQRHRLMTVEWQELTPAHGYTRPGAIDDAGMTAGFDEAMDRSAALWTVLSERFPERASYAVALAYRIRYAMQFNAREAMHLIELRTSVQGHPSYRAVGQQMHHLIAERAGHRAIAEMMRFVDHSGEAELERLGAERRAESRRIDLA